MDELHGVISHTWEEMLFESMVVGEGLALVLIYFYHDVISDLPIRRGLQRVIHDEESHVDYGERKIMHYLAQQPSLRERLLVYAGAVGPALCGCYYRPNTSRSVRRNDCRVSHGDHSDASDTAPADGDTGGVRPKT